MRRVAALVLATLLLSGLGPSPAAGQREPVDLAQPDDALIAQAEAIARAAPDFQPRAQWVERMRALMRRDP